MIKREKYQELVELMENFPAVAIIGPRQVGKTTLAQAVSENYKSIYLDLESEADRAKLSERRLLEAASDAHRPLQYTLLS